MNDAAPLDNISEVKAPLMSEEATRKGMGFSLRDISVRYGGIAALESITIDVSAGERLGIIGNNGAGKSTLCDVITGLTKPSEGDVFIAEKKATRTSALRRARNGMRRVFQHPVIFSDLTLEENVMIGAPHSPSDGIVAATFFPKIFYKEKRETALRILDFCQIDKDYTGNLEHLPYGTKKRLELARALMGNPRILILDEPAASMDDDERAHYCEVVSDYCQTYSTTLVVVEHDIEFIRALCDRAVVIDAGHVLADGEVLAVLHNEDVMSRYLGTEQ